jgi:lactate permease
MLVVADGLRGLRECWKLALVADVVLLVSWVVVAPTLGCELPNIVGGIAIMSVFAAMGKRGGIDLRRQAWAWMPFTFVVVALGCAALLPPDKKISPGFVILPAALLGGLCQKVSPAKIAVVAWRTVLRYSTALLTICAVLALAKTMGAAGMTRALADALIAATGPCYPAVSAIVGALGGFVTGSGTSTNVLFGSLQASVGAAESQKLLFAAANVMGAGIGKMLCPQSIVLGCAAAGLAGKERDVMSAAVRYFLIVLAVACASVAVAAID